MIGLSRFSVGTTTKFVPKMAAFLAAFLVFGHPSAFASIPKSSADPTGDIWFGIYLLGRPIGGSHATSSKVSYNGRSCLLTTSVSHTAITVMGASIEQDVVSRDWIDAVTGNPVHEVDDMASGGATTSVTAEFAGDAVTAVLRSGDSSETHVLKVPAGCVLMADDPTMSPPTDRKKRYVYFDPETLSLDPISVTPAPGQPSVHPRRLVVTMPTGSVTVEQDERGVPLRMDMPGGISMVRQTEAVVSAYLTGDKFTTSGTDARQPEAKALDFAVVTAVSPTGQPLLGSPTTLVAKVTMATGSSILYTIHKVATPSKMPFGDSINDIRGRSDLSAYLANTAYVDCNDPKIVGEAREVAGARTNLYEIAVQIQEWVHQQMSPTPTMGLPRTAVEIMGDRRGVCRDYALLFTALARAAHLPTRLCAGLVGYQGRFYYHAWAESYVGGSIGWMPFDPTLDELPVDASHIPLVKGDPVSLYDLVGNIGATRVKIMRCER